MGISMWNECANSHNEGDRRCINIHLRTVRIIIVVGRLIIQDYSGYEPLDSITLQV